MLWYLPCYFYCIEWVFKTLLRPMTGSILQHFSLLETILQEFSLHLKPSTNVCLLKIRDADHRKYFWMAAHGYVWNVCILCLIELLNSSPFFLVPALQTKNWPIKINRLKHGKRWCDRRIIPLIILCLLHKRKTIFSFNLNSLMPLDFPCCTQSPLKCTNN